MRLVVLALIVLAAVAAWAMGLHEHLSIEALRVAVHDAGPWGPLLFLAAFVAAELLHFPGGVFVFGAAVIWPLPEALAWSWLGAVAASICVFAVARYSVRESVERRIPERLRHYDAKLATHGFRTVVLIRLVTFLAPTFHWLLGASKVSFRDLALGSAVGLVPGILAIVLLGDAITSDRGAIGIATVAAVLLLAVGAVIWLRRRNPVTS